MNDANWKDIHLLGGPAYYLGGCQYIYNGASGARFGFQPSGNNEHNAWITTHTGAAAGRISGTLVLPPGVVSMVIDSHFSVDARTGAVCDYVNGVNFSFGDLPAGLTWTSESGVFLRNTTAGGLDSDGDGTPNVSDECPNDPQKTNPGLCGCGAVDVDADSDGVCDPANNNGNENANSSSNANSYSTENANANTTMNGNTNSGGTANENRNANSGDGGPISGGVGPCAPVSMLMLSPLGLAVLRRRYFA